MTQEVPATPDVKHSPARTAKLVALVALLLVVVGGGGYMAFRGPVRGNPGATNLLRPSYP